jgi:hypothetical protein
MILAVLNLWSLVPDSYLKYNFRVVYVPPLYICIRKGEEVWQALILILIASLMS